MPNDTFNMIADGLFTSTVIYGLPVYGNVWLPEDSNTRFRSFTKEDSRRLQVIQNKVLRMKTNLPKSTATSELINKSGDLSINQLAAYHSLLVTHKITRSNKPDYLAAKLKLRVPNGENVFPHRQSHTIPISGNLSISRSGFCHRSARIWNSLPLDLRSCDVPAIFKKAAKKWVKTHIPVKPP